MKKHYKNIDDLYRDRLQTDLGSEDISTDAWKALEKRLIGYNKTHQFRFFNRWWNIPVLIVFSLLFLGGSEKQNITNVNATTPLLKDNIPNTKPASDHVNIIPITISGITHNTRHSQKQTGLVHNNSSISKTGKQKKYIDNCAEDQPQKTLVLKPVASDDTAANVTVAIQRSLVQQNIPPKKDTIPSAIFNNSLNKIETFKKMEIIPDRLTIGNFCSLESNMAINNISTISLSSNEDNPRGKKVKKHIPIDFGLNASIEKGAGIINLVGSEYFKFGITGRFSFLLQPGAKNIMLNNNYLSQKSYYNIIGNRVDTAIWIYGTVYHWSYTFNQQYDSIIVRRAIKQPLWQFELPVLLDYKLNNDFSVFAGAVINIGRIAEINEDIITNRVSVSDSVIASLVPLSFNEVYNHFNHTGALYSTYRPYQNTSSYQYRIGYMIGFTYAYTHNVSMSASLQQNIGSFSDIQDADLRNIYTQPYIRFSIGYKLFSNNKR